MQDRWCADGRVRGPVILVDSSPASAPDIASLGICDAATRRRLKAAVETAATQRRASTIRCREEGEPFGRLFTVHPAAAPGHVIITVTDLDQPAGELDPAVLTDVLGITWTEAEIAAALFRGMSLADIAQQRDVQLETVRGQVKSILQKSAQPNQKQLLLLLARIAIAVSLTERLHPRIDAVDGR